MRPIWKVKSGRFYGWIDKSNFLYNQYGLNIGYLKSEIFYKLNGQYLGDLYHFDRIGFKLGEYHDSCSLVNFENPINPPSPPEHKEPILEYGWDDIKE